MRSTCDSAANAFCGCPGARACPAGTWFVYTVVASTRAAGTRYPASVSIASPGMSVITGFPAAYAPPSKTTREVCARIRPSASTPVRSVIVAACRVFVAWRSSA